MSEKLPTTPIILFYIPINLSKRKIHSMHHRLEFWKSFSFWLSRSLARLASVTVWRLAATCHLTRASYTLLTMSPGAATQVLTLTLNSELVTTCTGKRKSYQMVVMMGLPGAITLKGHTATERLQGVRVTRYVGALLSWNEWMLWKKLNSRLNTLSSRCW